MQQIVESCPACGQSIDVTEQAPFSEVTCPECGATMRARIQFNNYTLLELLGEGGMGSVFKAIDRNLHRNVALKILKRDAASTAMDWEKLASEARLTAAVSHPNVVKVFSFGEDHGQFYLAMELVEKGSLDGLMMLQGKVAEVQVLDLGVQAAEGLRAAYEVGLIHRDIKPGNILFATPKLAKLVDFGLARVFDEEAHEAGEIWGTPFYVAPEKLDGRPEDFRSDIYSLGGTLFHALAGRPPFDAKTASMVVLKHIKSQAVSLQAFAPSISDETAYVINRMLHRDPDKRYSSYDELLTHLNYARQRLLKRTTGVKGAPVEKAAAKAGGGRPFLKAVWTVAAALCLIAGAGFLGLRVSASHAANSNSAPPDPAAALIEQGRQALNARRFDEAGAKFAAAVEAGGGQPARNWALAQLGLSRVLAGDEAHAHETFAQLEKDGLFSIALTAQPLGHFFVELGQTMAGGQVISLATGECFGGTNYDAFALLAFGLRDWTAGDVESGGALIERFDRSSPQPPDRWLANLKPLTALYLAEFRRYVALREQVKKASKAQAADLLVRIEQAKGEVKTGDRMVEQLDSLAQGVHLE
ncbi:MAG: protein kinase [Terrimicrobiaceae bacterium]|nr:protein kinase [Terrimicrobiaceae bacterium]